MRTVVITLGSAGDLHPFLAVARALAERGDEVEVMSNAPYEDDVRREGLAFTPLCSERDHRRTEEHPDLWHPLRGFGVLWRHLAVPAIEPVRLRLLDLMRSGGADPVPLRVLASPLAVGARIAREQQAFGLCSLYTAPANLRSTSDPMYLGSWHVPRWLPRAARRTLWWALDKRKLEPMARPVIDGAHRSLGLSRPRGSLFGRWIHSPDGGVTLFPESFCAPQRGWPERTWVGDFPLFRSLIDQRLDRELEQFLASGDPPVVIFSGSAPGEHGKILMRDSLTACRALGLRSVALGPAAVMTDSIVDAGDVDADADFVHRARHAPLELLLPRAAVFIHHGGIGSCAQGLRARVPQLIRPFAYDQFDNAARVEEDGGGRFIPRGSGGRAAFLSALHDLSLNGGAIGSARQHTEPRGMELILNALEQWEASFSRTPVP